MGHDQKRLNSPIVWIFQHVAKDQLEIAGNIRIFISYRSNSINEKPKYAK